jgi:hypothetical protein
VFCIHEFGERHAPDTEVCADVCILTAFGFINSVVTTILFSLAARAITKGSATRPPRADILRLHVEIFAELRFVDAVLMVLIEREGGIIAPEIRKLAPIRISAASLLLLGGPFPCCASVVLLRDQIAVEELAKDKLAADVKASREHFGRLLVWPLTGKGRLERLAALEKKRPR